MRINLKNMISKFNFLLKKNGFFQRFGFPFVILILVGAVVYLGSVIGKMNDEQASIQALIDSSEPTHIVRLPQGIKTKSWGVFRAGFGGLRFKYPVNWRILSGSGEKIIREGEGALVSVEASSADTSGESMVAYRVARIAALHDLGYAITDIAKTIVGNDQALMFEGRGADGETIHESALLRRGIFYTFTMLIKSNISEFGREDIVKEYKEIISTISFE